MRYATIEKDGLIPVILTDDNTRVLPINEALGSDYPDLMSFIKGHSSSQIETLRKISASNKGTDLASVRLTAPICRSIHDIICVGINYSAHMEEHKKHFVSGEFIEPPKAVYFGKRAITITGPEEDICGHLDMDQKLDYEAELAVVIGRTVNSETRYEDIGSCVFGYSVFNDISARATQKAHDQWYYGKSMDTFSVMGPWIVGSDEIAINEPLDIRSRVNGETRQNSNTSMMIRNVSDLIYELSRGITLEPGDIIATGTPSGVGQGFTPPRFMKAGDVVEAEIERIGILRNRIQ